MNISKFLEGDWYELSTRPAFRWLAGLLAVAAVVAIIVSVVGLLGNGTTIDEDSVSSGINEAPVLCFMAGFFALIACGRQAGALNFLASFVFLGGIFMISNGDFAGFGLLFVPFYVMSIASKKNLDSQGKAVDPEQ